MTTEDTAQDLRALFAAEDERFEPDTFTQAVIAPIERHSARRRLVLSGAALIGGVVAGSQLPGLLSDAASMGSAMASAWIGVQDTVSAAQSMNPIWLSAIVLIAFCGCAITLFERA